MIASDVLALPEKDRFQVVMMELRDIKEATNRLAEFCIRFAREHLDIEICGIDCFNVPSCACDRCPQHCRCALSCARCQEYVDPVVGYCERCSADELVGV